MPRQRVERQKSGRGNDAALVARDWNRMLERGLPRLRRQRRWTQHDLAEASGLHRETISRLERPTGSRRHPSYHTLRALALAFNHDDLATFWQTLGNIAADDSAASWVEVTGRERQLIMGFATLTPEGQELIELIVALFRTRLEAHAGGDGVLDDMTALLALLHGRPR